MSIQKPRPRVLPALPGLSLALGLSLAAIAFVAQAPTAAAHAEYTSSVPAAHSTVTKAPSTVTVHFGEDLDSAGSDLIVYDTKGKVVSTAAQVDTSDAKTMTVPMKGDDADSYLVVWHTISLDDGDAAVGAFIFNVGSQAKPGDGGGSTTSPGAAAAKASGETSGVAGWVVALAGVAGLLVGAVGTFALVGRRNQGKA